MGERDQRSDIMIVTRRHPYAKPPYRQPDRGPDGRRRCRWCWGPVPKGRLTWCGDECVAEYKLHHNWETILAFVLDRDRGVCALCGCDTLWLQQALRATRDAVKRSEDMAHWCWSKLYRVCPRRGKVTCLRELANRLTGGRFYEQPWEADHIHARADGGPDHPSNLRTLCVPCHKRRTAEQARDRARRRRESKAVLFCQEPKC